jgi:rhamnulokinase
LFSSTIEPGTNLGSLQKSVIAQTGLEAAKVIVPATHDTASAVLAVPASNFASTKPDWCYISSGTWSLMGCELASPLVNARCAELNFTNEGGVRGSTRLLKNIGGLWVFQQIRKSLERRGQAVSWDEMVNQAKTAAPFALLLNPDDRELLAPDDMINAIEKIARSTGQAIPKDHGVLYRAALEGLALRYRQCLAMLESLVGNRIETIHIVGGGVQNELLCQMTADACDRIVVAGPVEATAIGNVLMQMMGCGYLSSINDAREVVLRSAGTVRYEPHTPERWHAPADQFTRLTSRT